MAIPAALLHDIQQVPSAARAALLMRHAPRHPIADPFKYADAGLTEEGVRLAEALGAWLQSRVRAGRLVASPVARCLATAAALARGAGWDLEPQVDERLSHEFIAPAWYLLDHTRVRLSLPFQVRTLLELMLPPGAGDASAAPDLPRLDVLVTHDTVLGAAARSLLGADVHGDHWPQFLEGLLLWRAGGRVFARWRGTEYQFSEIFERIE